MNKISYELTFFCSLTDGDRMPNFLVGEVFLRNLINGKLRLRHKQFSLGSFDFLSELNLERKINNKRELL